MSFISDALSAAQRTAELVRKRAEEESKRKTKEASEKKPNELQEYRKMKRAEELQDKIEDKKKEYEFHASGEHGSDPAKAVAAKEELKKMEAELAGLMKFDCVKDMVELQEKKDERKDIEEELQKAEAGMNDCRAYGSMEGYLKAKEAYTEAKEKLDAIDEDIAKLEKTGTLSETQQKLDGAKGELKDLEEELEKAKDAVGSVGSYSVDGALRAQEKVEELETEIKAKKAEIRELRTELRGGPANPEDKTDFSDKSKPSTGTEDTRPRGPQTKTHVVQQGDTASAIALEMLQKQGLIGKNKTMETLSAQDQKTLERGYTTLFKHNKECFDGSPDKLKWNDQDPKGNVLNTTLNFKEIWEVEDKVKTYGPGRP